MWGKKVGWIAQQDDPVLQLLYYYLSSKGRIWEQSLLSIALTVWHFQASYKPFDHPQGSGQVEKRNCMLLFMLRTLPDLRKESGMNCSTRWSRPTIVLLFVVWTNCIIKFCCLCYLLVGRTPHLPIDQLVFNLNQNCAQEDNNRYSACQKLAA